MLWPAATVVLGLGLVYCGFSHYVAYRLSQGRPLSVPVPLLDTALVSLPCGVSGGVESPAFVYFYVISLAVGVRFGWTAGLCMAALQTLFCLEPLFLLSVPEAAAGLQLASLVLAGGIGAALSPSPESAQSVHQPLSLHATERLWDIQPRAEQPGYRHRHAAGG